ncbi:DUF7169 domain-containing protein [Streptomyces sp. NPDC003027]
MNQLLDTLEHDVSELRQMVSIYEDAVTMPGRVPDVDVDGTGRQATHGPSRPTERIALDDQREALQRELNSGATHLPYAAAVVRGVIASMDRALSRWEGEGEVRERIGGVSP